MNTKRLHTYNQKHVPSKSKITLGLTEELLRNDPCHCGSGKKFKECHMKSQWPREYFEVPINPATPTGSTVVEYRNGKWEKIPGISLAMTVYVVDPQYVYNDVVDLLKPLSSMTFLQEQQRRLNHKLSAIMYHSINFKKEEGIGLNTIQLQ